MLGLSNIIMRPCVARMSTKALGLRISAPSGRLCRGGTGMPLATRAWLGTSRPSSFPTFARKMTRRASTMPTSPATNKNASPSSQHESPSASCGVSAPTLPPPTKFVYPERLCVYHAGTPRVTFLACLKVSTLFIFTFFAFVVTPMSLEQEGFSTNTLRTTAAAVVPLVFVAWATSPFVTFIHLRLPPYARQSEDMLRRYIANLSHPSPGTGTRSAGNIRVASASAGGSSARTELEITTMSYIAKPRLSMVKLEDLRPVRKRLGIVNYYRETAAENKRRKWYMFPAAANFSIQESSNTMPKVPWAWGMLAQRIAGLEGKS